MDIKRVFRKNFFCGEDQTPKVALTVVLRVFEWEGSAETGTRDCRISPKTKVWSRSTWKVPSVESLPCSYNKISTGQSFLLGKNVPRYPIGFCVIDEGELSSVDFSVMLLKIDSVPECKRMCSSRNSHACQEAMRSICGGDHKPCTNLSISQESRVQRWIYIPQGSHPIQHWYTREAISRFSFESYWSASV
jgi:hypothetical protein